LQLIRHFLVATIALLKSMLKKSNFFFVI
jgi:hypothetical protein